MIATSTSSTGLLGKTNPGAPGNSGYLMDAATGLWYMQQRYHDPQIGTVGQR